jgi:hypothetical protein
MKTLLKLLVVTLFLNSIVFSQYSIYEPLNLDDVNYSLKDFGTMWTFDDLPFSYWEKEYNFTPNKDWIKHVQLSALQFGGGCSAAFVSEDGLIMTNHHCGRGELTSLQKEGENLLRDGFYAKSFEDERKVPNLFVDQLIDIVDVTQQIKDAMNKGKSDNEKIKMRDEKIREIEEEKTKQSGMVCKVVTLYNGGKYSLYSYKRYNDIRLVMAPDFQIATTGWDWDNFTYPRYELDFMFYRAYDENGNPIKSNHYFKWSKNGASEGEPIFVVGRPGNTDRLMSVADLEFFRNEIYPNTVIIFNELYNVYYQTMTEHPEKETELLLSVMGVGNGRKSYAGRLLGLLDNYLMEKKKKFEKDLIAKVNSDAKLKEKYGHIWQSIKNLRDEMKIFVDEYNALITSFIRPVPISSASAIAKYFSQMNLPDDKKENAFKSENILKTISRIFSQNADRDFQLKMLTAHSNMLYKILGKDNIYSRVLYNGMHGNDAAEYLLSKTKFFDNKYVNELIKLSPEEYSKLDDPVLIFAKLAEDKTNELRSKFNEISNSLEVLHQDLGELIFKIYGSQIAPDATSTLRISDGMIKGYEYNGTIAPGKTTYFGLYDRYNSFNKKSYPWGLHERWQIPNKELDLSTFIGFASTNDIVGGNSGSSIINKNAEVVGIAHDGNLESLAGHFAFLPENNRTVASDSYGLITALKLVFKTERLVKELESGKAIQ